MSVYIKGMEMPSGCYNCPFDNGEFCMAYPLSESMGYDIADGKPEWCPLVEIKAPHGRLGDLDALRARIYHEAFETDSNMQRWESGCWIRYKLFERTEEAAPTIIPAEEC